MAVIEGYLMPHPPVLIPEVGQGKERECQATLDALEIVAKRIQDLKPQTIIVISPHGPVFSDGIAINTTNPMVGSLKSFGVSGVSISKENDLDLVKSIVLKATSKGIATAKIDLRFAKEHHISSDIDHGAIVPLYFAEKYYAGAQLVHITYGLLSRSQLYSFGVGVLEAVKELNRDVVVIASGDLSHRLLDSGPYDFNPAGPKFDIELLDYLEDADFLRMLKMPEKDVEEAGECGYRSLNIIAGIFDGKSLKSNRLSYEGPFGVGYGVVQFIVTGEDRTREIFSEINRHRKSLLEAIRSNEDEYVRLARETMEQFVINGTIPDLKNGLPKEMIEKSAGVFVSIKSNGGLRGCIGTTSATTSSIAKEIISNAIKAATEDPRFSPIEENELDDLIITVDVLLPSEKIDSQSELDPKQYGVIVSSGYKRGLLLPNIEGVETVEEQIQISLSKAGIKSDEPYEMERFKVIRHN